MNFNLKNFFTLLISLGLIANPAFAIIQQEGRGHETETVGLLDLTGDIKINAQQVKIDIGTKGGSLNTALTNLANKPGMEWISKLNDDPVLKGKIDWKIIEEVHKNWDYKSQSLTPEMAAVVAVVASAVAGPMAGSLINQAVNSAVSGQFDAKGFIQQMVVQYASAGLSGAAGNTAFMQGFAGNGFSDVLMKNLVNNSINASVSSAVYGTDLGDGLRSGITSAFISAGSASAAGWIGGKYAAGSAVGGVGSADYWIHKGLHAGLGCATAIANKANCGAGAAGAVVGEVVAEKIGLDRVSENGRFTDEDKQDILDTVKLSTAVAALAAGGSAEDINTAVGAASNAAENNGVPLLVVVGAALWVGDKAITISEMNDLADELDKANTDQEGEEIMKRYAKEKGDEKIAGALLGVFGTYGVKGIKALAKVMGKEGGSATKKTGDFVDLTTEKRRKHILDGDATGGGHRAGTGITGKTEFPQGWSDDKITHAISDIATDPKLQWTKPDKLGRITTTGIRNGVEIKVVYDTLRKEIVTAHPVNLPRNP